MSNLQKQHRKEKNLQTAFIACVFALTGEYNSQNSLTEKEYALALCNQFQDFTWSTAELCKQTPDQLKFLGQLLPKILLTMFKKKKIA